MTTRSRLAVLGSPISHSLSPVIHRAAYGILGVDWSYEAVEVTEQSLPSFVSSRDSTWRGLSLTMPLKREVLPLLTWRDPLVDTVGAANTLLWGEDSALLGFNTDVYGVERSFRDAGVESLDLVHVLGAGATAASVIAGVARLGATRVQVLARSPERVRVLSVLGENLGVRVTAIPWDDGLTGHPDAVVSTVPGGADLPDFLDETRRTSVLFDVAYDPWPSPLATSWGSVGGIVISGLDLLVNQAVGQLRIFVAGEPTTPLAHEHAVVSAMRAALEAR